MSLTPALRADDRPAGEPAPKALLASAEWNLCIDGPRCGDIGRQILALTDADPAHPARADAWWHIAYASVRGGIPGAGTEANARAREGFAARGDARGLLMCDEVDVLLLRIQGRLAEALLLNQHIAARTEVSRRPTDLYITRTSLAITLKLMGQPEDALREFYRAQAAAQDCASPGPRIMALVNLSAAHGDLHNLADAQALGAEAMELAEPAGAWVPFAVAAFNLIIAYDGLGDARGCGAVLERLFAHEARLPPNTLGEYAPLVAMACLAIGDLAGTRRWLDEGASSGVGSGDSKTEFARVNAGWLMAQGRHAEARAVAEERLACCDGLMDLPYPRMRLLQAAAAACEGLDEPWAALRHLRESHTLHETLAHRTARARFIALQAAQEVETTRQERDRARAAAAASERDRQRLAALNDALQGKIAEAEALQVQLREQALHDPLTGLYNRRFLAEAAASRIELARRNRMPLCIVLIDVDHFKQVNDRHGHDAGDQVLVALAQLLQQRLRRSDIVCRFGGEEFVLLVDPCAEDAARGLLEELLGRFRAIEFGGGGEAFAGETFSAGLAMLGDDGDDFEGLAKIADQRMYRAKAMGRARVCGRGD